MVYKGHRLFIKVHFLAQSLLDSIVEMTVKFLIQQIARCQWLIPVKIYNLGKTERISANNVEGYFFAAVQRICTAVLTKSICGIATHLGYVCLFCNDL